MSTACYPLVKAKLKQEEPWHEYETRTLAQLDLPAALPEIPLSRYGGRLDRRVEPTGFFHARNVDGRWWLVDPEGCLFVHVGVVNVTPGRSRNMQTAFQARFGTPEAWADYTTRMLKAHHFNGTGAWSDVELIRKAPTKLAYTCIWNFLAEFGKSKGIAHMEPGHYGYAGGCMPVFLPDFEAFCDRHARQLLAYKDDPWLVGHFSDNELPGRKDSLDRFLALDPNDPNLAPSYHAAAEWLAARKGRTAGLDDVTDEDRDAFLGYVFERYFRVTTEAIKRHDPNHLALGPRLHSYEKYVSSVFQAAGRYLDVIAVNYYRVWGPQKQDLDNWIAWSGKPVMITEWYAKGADAGLPNHSGAGWTVPTQRDRGLFYQHYVLGLLESRKCVGWHWFKYMDNDPEDLTTDPSNRDSNKGIVTIRYEEYTPLLEMMRDLNRVLYQVMDHFDAA